MIKSDTMHKTLQRSLLMLFALLQCVSPLAHAHVDGIDSSVDRSVYSHNLSGFESMTASHVENDQGAVIAMPQICPSRGSVLLAAHPAPLENIQIVARPASVQHISDLNSAVVYFPACHILPWSQAPPYLG